MGQAPRLRRPPRPPRARQRASEGHRMQADLWKKVDDLYQAALAQPPEKRAAFLEQACPDGLQLRGEVQSPALNWERLHNK